MNEIKLDIQESNKLTSFNEPAKKNTFLSKETIEPDVTIQLSNMANVYLAETNSNELARTMQLKEQIESNQYQLNTPELVQKLYHELITPNLFG